MVSVIVLTNKIAIFIKYKLMGIAESMGKYFKVAAIRIRPGNYTTIGMFPFGSVGAFSIKSDIAYVPVDAAIGSYFYTGHAMASKTYMYSIPMRNRFFFVSYSVSIFII